MTIQQVILRLPKILRRHRLIQLMLRLIASARIQQFRFNEHSLAIADISDPNPRNVLITQYFEKDFFEIASPFLNKPNAVFFDVGANWGFCSWGLLDPEKKSTLNLHLFEANPYIAEILDRTAKLYKENISVVHGAVSDKEGDSYLMINAGELGQSYISDQGVKVPNISLDNYAKDNQIDAVDFMKMDIEGYEWFALHSAREMLQRKAIKAIYFECVFVHLQRNGMLPDDVFNLLTGYGYSIYYCKDVDSYERGIVNEEDITSITVNGQSLRVAPLKNYNKLKEYGHNGTDLLAIA